MWGRVAVSLIAVVVLSVSSASAMPAAVSGSVEPKRTIPDVALSVKTQPAGKYVLTLGEVKKTLGIDTFWTLAAGKGLGPGRQINPSRLVRASPKERPAVTRNYAGPYSNVYTVLNVDEDNARIEKEFAEDKKRVAESPYYVIRSSTDNLFVFYTPKGWKDARSVDVFIHETGVTVRAGCETYKPEVTEASLTNCAAKLAKAQLEKGNRLFPLK